jgi:hypothetical protein
MLSTILRWMRALSWIIRSLELKAPVLVGAWVGAGLNFLVLPFP